MHVFSILYTFIIMFEYLDRKKKKQQMIRKRHLEKLLYIHDFLLTLPNEQ